MSYRQRPVVFTVKTKGLAEHLVWITFDMCNKQETLYFIFEEIKTRSAEETVETACDLGGKLNDSPRQRIQVASTHPFSFLKLKSSLKGAYLT